MRSLEIAGRRIGADAPPWIIAEIGINHDGDLDAAKNLIRAAADCGTDAVKLQVFQPHAFISRNSPYIGIFEKTQLRPETLGELLTLAADVGVAIFPTVFDEESATLCDGLDVSAMKIASGDITHIPLIRHVAAFGRPMLLSTGGATMAETAAALDAIEDVSSGLPVGLFHCVSNYPTQPSDTNLACMRTMREAFGVPVGFSDHTEGTTIPIAAVALGADMIEKHFTLDRAADGPDHALSADPEIMRDIVAATRAAHQAVGSARKRPVESPDFIPVIRRSVTADKAIPKGTTITADMLAVKRPGDGIPPEQRDRVIGRTASRDIAADQTISWDML